MIRKSRSHWLVVGLVIGVAIAGQALAADLYQGTAVFTNADGKRDSAKVMISLEQATPEAERLAMVEKVRGNPAAAKSVLAGQKAIGYIEARDRRVPIRFANISPGGSGQLITVISDEALGYIGGEKKYPKPKEGFDLTYAMFSMSAAGKGNGQMAPACKVKWMESGAPAVEDYGQHVVWFDDVVKVTPQ